MRLDRSGKMLQIKLKFIANTFFTRLQNSPYFCVFKYARTVKQKVWNEAENRERDLRDYGRVRLARFARKTLTPLFNDFFTDFEKKTRLFCSLFFYQFCFNDLINNPLILKSAYCFLLRIQDFYCSRSL